MRSLPKIEIVRIPDPKELVGIATTSEIRSPIIQVDTPQSQEIWEQFLRVQIKPTTQGVYRWAIKSFCEDVAPDRSPSDFMAGFLALPQREATQLILEWRKSKIDGGFGTATINQRLAAIKSLVNFAHKAGICSYTLGTIKALKSEAYRDTRGISVEEYRSVLATVDRSTDLGIRDYAILRLLWDLALRRGEVVSLDVGHYLPGKLMVLGKGKIDRSALDISAGLGDVLDEWVSIRKGLYFQPKKGKQEPALFLSCNGRRLTGAELWKIVSETAAAVGVKLSPHGVRHSAITGFLDASGGDVRSAQSLSRHADPRTLMIYDDNRQGLQAKATQALGDLLD
jgi:integrase/recombinase XerC